MSGQIPCGGMRAVPGQLPLPVAGHQHRPQAGQNLLRVSGQAGQQGKNIFEAFEVYAAKKAEQNPKPMQQSFVSFTGAQDGKYLGGGRDRS